MTNAADTLDRLARERGVSLASLSAMIGRNAAYLQQFVRRGTPRRLAEDDRRLLARFFGVSEGLLGAAAAEPQVRVPRLDVAASAGPGAYNGDAAAAELGAGLIDPATARRLGLRAGHVAAIRVRGDSMAPGLLDGDHIVVDTADRSPGARAGLYVIELGGAVMVKRVRRSGGSLVVTSDNPAAPAIDAGAGPEVIGRVVWQMREPR